MKNNIINCIIPVTIMAAIGASLLSGCEKVIDDESTVTPSVSSMIFEADETDEMTESETETTTTTAAESSAVETDTVRETALNETSASEIDTVENTEITEEPTYEVTTSETSEALNFQSPKYIAGFNFTDAEKMQLESELYQMTSTRIDDNIILPEGKVTEKHIGNYVFMTFGNGEGLWGLDYIETIDLSRKSDPLRKFDSFGLCDVYDAEGVDRFLYNVFGYKATHEEAYRYVYYHDGKYYKFTGDGGGMNDLKIESITEPESGTYRADYIYTDYYCNSTLYLSAVFNVFDDNGRTRFHYCSVTANTPAPDDLSDKSGEWYMEVIGQYRDVLNNGISYDMLDEEKHKYVPSLAAHYQKMPEWYLYDIDGNGTEELICQYNIYLYDNGEIYMLFDPDGKHISLGERSRMSFYKSGIIGVHWAGSAVCFANEYFIIDVNKLKTIDEIHYDEYEDEINPVWLDKDPDTHYPADYYKEYIYSAYEEIDISRYQITV